MREQLHRGLHELQTPALILHRDALDRNIAAMSRWAAGVVGLRPHAKIHKCPPIARRQIAAGAIGVTVATLPEALSMVDAGVSEVLIANEIVDPAKLALLAERARGAGLLLAVDDTLGVERLSAAAVAAGSTVGVLIEIDVGMTRGGVRSREDAARLADRIADSRGVQLRGVMGYEGHAVLEPDRVTRAQKAAAAMDDLAEHVAALRDRGFAIEIVSAGGTTTYDMTGPHDVVTELQGGTYALMDTAYQPLAPNFELALGVLGSVVSRHADRIVLDCGTKVIGTINIAEPQVVGFDLGVDELHEEHALLSSRSPAPGAETRVSFGDRVELMVPSCGGTTNLHTGYCVVEDGEVVETWPILASGAGHS